MRLLGPNVPEFLSFPKLNLFFLLIFSILHLGGCNSRLFWPSPTCICSINNPVESTFEPDTWQRSSCFVFFISGRISVKWSYRCHGNVCDIWRYLSESSTQLVRKVAGSWLFFPLCDCTGSKFHFHSQVSDTLLSMFTQNVWRIASLVKSVLGILSRKKDYYSQLACSFLCRSSRIQFFGAIKSLFCLFSV